MAASSGSEFVRVGEIGIDMMRRLVREQAGPLLSRAEEMHRAYGPRVVPAILGAAQEGSLARALHALEDKVPQGEDAMAAELQRLARGMEIHVALPADGSVS